MGDKDFMMQQIHDKLEAGYNCLKMKVGAMDIRTELEILKSIRKKYSPSVITIRLDANGAYDPRQVLKNLENFSAFGIHSIEQPIRAGQIQAMHDLCLNTPIPIALDEELIRVTGRQKEALLDNIKPQYIIIKPTLVGGLSASGQWIKLAEKRNIGWWITSALESNIGLNAIAQFTAGYQTNMHQGLGTGQLYHNNFGSPLYIKDGYLGYDQTKNWNLSALDF
jgi:L-alanine-DL-glutamate epimerase-like enolase superfamily enzyme